MSNKLFGIVIITSLIILNIYPVKQFAETGYLFYQNAYDEPAYLSYDYAKNTIGTARYGIANFSVLFGHNIGLSGGAINFILDVFCIVAFPLLIRRILYEIGLPLREANAFALFLTWVPIFFGGANPLIQHALEYTSSTNLISWICIPQAHFSPLFRSPEPQLSFIWLALGLYLAVRLKSFIPAYIAVVISYQLLLLPVLYILLAYHIYSLSHNKTKYSSWLSASGAFLLISFALKVYYPLLAPKGQMQDYFIYSRYPMFSLMSIVSLIIFVPAWKHIEKEYRSLALFFALSPLAVVNTQIIAGGFFPPIGFEQYFGVFAPGIVCFFALKGKKFDYLRYCVVLSALSAILLCAYSGFNWTYTLNKHILLNDTYLSLLRSDSSHVAANDINVSDVLGMLFPKQKPTMFSSAKAIKNYNINSGENSCSEYLCAKKLTIEDPERGRAFDPVLQALDRRYRYATVDFFLANIREKEPPRLVCDTEKLPEECPPMALHYMYDNRTLTRGVIEGTEIKEIPLFNSQDLIRGLERNAYGEISKDDFLSVENGAVLWRASTVKDHLATPFIPLNREAGSSDSGLRVRMTVVPHGLPASDCKVVIQDQGYGTLLDVPCCYPEEIAPTSSHTIERYIRVPVSVQKVRVLFYSRNGKETYIPSSIEISQLLLGQ